MTRKLKRSRDFEIVLDIKRDDFIAPPRPAQRNWLLNRLVSEWAAELNHLHERAPGFVPGRDPLAGVDKSRAELDDQAIMEDWQIPVMRAMAEAVGTTRGEILEVGFGRGVSAGFIQQIGVSSHTIVECNDYIVARFEAWRAEYGHRDIRLLHGRWQDVTNRFATYDGIFFHAYPLSEEEFIDEVVKTTTFAEHFFPFAVKHLKAGGVFTYLTNEMDSLSRAHQRLLFDHFESFSMQRIDGLSVPEETTDTLWGDSMVVVKAMKSSPAIGPHEKHP